ncbi:hypothetical protein PCANC_28614 [Puccinia coronata f. sp. avenae]|uniref:Uncharacterized protein n=1 Tax=Puccinia coronata f. sp. avenae TaxID=200324 RepID=A0A2N5S0A1_9BASI|nr:hypothetical protein PCANC_28614 [Puccinia coronata f. sp. avenae]
MFYIPTPGTPFHTATLPLNMSDLFPMITDLTQVIPHPFTFQALVPKGVFSPPNTLRLVCRIGGLHPHFLTNPHKFTIPGRLIGDTRNFFQGHVSNCVMESTPAYQSHPSQKYIGRPPSPLQAGVSLPLRRVL